MSSRYTMLVNDPAITGNAELCRALEREGFVIEAVPDQDRLTGRLREGGADLVVLDISLDADADFFFLAQMRHYHPHEHLPILASAARGMTTRAALALSKGADEILFTDDDPELTTARLTSFMQQHRRLTDLVASEGRYALAARGSRDGLFDWDLESGRIYYSNEWKLLLGISVVDHLDSPDDWFTRIHEDDRALLRSRLALHVEGVTPGFECQSRMLHEDGHYIWVLARGICERDADDRAVRLVGTITDLSQRSLHDRRTGLPYRELFMERLEQAVAECQLDPERFFSIMHVEIDRFKLISEGYGHDILDRLLIGISRRIERCVGAGDTLAFLGGESFVILLPDTADLSHADGVANQIHLQLIAPFQLDENEVFTKASIGITKLSCKKSNREELLREAQTAMRFARRLGSGHTERFGADMTSRGRELLELETGLRSALDREEFLLYYQPQTRLTDNEITGFEVLLRWKRADGSMVSPGTFVPIAEETDLILTIGEWVLRTACQQSVAWQKQGLPPLRVGINLSERQFRARNLIGLVRQVLDETGLQPELLELEITESIFMEETEQALRILASFRELGIKIALDDFGTGYSSLNYLKRIPFTTLKIDKTFINDMTTELGDAAICSSIIELAHKLSMEVIAEGVETKEQLMILRAFLCDEVQGFIFSKPLPANEFESMIRERSEKS